MRLTAIVCFIFILASTLSWSRDVRADRRVFLNGVNIDNIRGKSFKGCDITIDESGNIHISSDNYTVKEEKTQPPPKTTTKPGQNFWLISSKNNPGSTQYTMVVSINGTWVAAAKSADDQLILDITPFLSRGSNSIRIQATKELTKTRKSYSPSDHFTLIIGAGDKDGLQVTLKSTLLTYKRTANEVQDFNEVFIIEVP